MLIVLAALFSICCGSRPERTASFEHDLHNLRISDDYIITPESGCAYDKATTQFDQRYNGEPDYVFKCHSIDDVEEVLEFLLNHGEKFVIKSEGHSSGGYSMCSGACSVINVHELKDIQVNENEPSVTFGPGHEAHTLANALEEEHLTKKYWVTIGLDNVGVGGHVHGGGWGMGLRKFGMATDNLIEATVLTYVAKNNKYDVYRKKASATQNSDLFSCIRGVGGPSCGIVVSYTLRIYEQPPQVLALAAAWLFPRNLPVAPGVSIPGTTFKGIIDDDFIALAEDDNQVDYESLIFGLIADVPRMNSTTGTPVFPIVLDRFLMVTLGAFWTGDNTTEGEIFLNSFQTKFDNNALGIPLSPFLITFKMESGSWARVRCSLSLSDEICETIGNDHTGHQGAYDVPARSALINSRAEYDIWLNDPNGAQYLWDQMYEKCPVHSLINLGMSGVPHYGRYQCGYYMSTWGGTGYKSVSPTETGNPYRDAIFDLTHITTWFHVDYQEIGITMDAMSTDIWLKWQNNDLVPKQHYVNYINPLLGDEYLDWYYGSNKDRIQATKCDWDPLNHFTNPQGVVSDGQDGKVECDSINGGATDYPDIPQGEAMESTPFFSNTTNVAVVVVIVCIVVGAILIGAIVYFCLKRYNVKIMRRDGNVEKMLEENIERDDHEVRESNQKIQHAQGNSVDLGELNVDTQEIEV